MEWLDTVQEDERVTMSAALTNQLPLQRRARRVVEEAPRPQLELPLERPRDDRIGDAGCREDGGAHRDGQRGIAFIDFFT